MKKVGLWLKFVVAFVIIQIAALSVIGYLGTLQIRSGLEAEKQKQGIIVVDLLTSAAMPAIFSNDFVALQSEVDSVFSSSDNTEVNSIVIRNQEGRIIAEKQRPDADEISNLKIDKQIYYKGESFGTIQVSMSTAAISRNVNQILIFLALPLIAAAVIAGMSVLYLIFFLVTKPLDKLVEATQDVASGDYSGTVDFERNDEFGVLAGAFNKMTKHLAENEGQLKGRLNDLATLYETGLSISGSLDTEKIMRTILDNLAVTLPIRSGTIFVIDKRTGKLTAKASFGPPGETDERNRLEMSRKLAERALETGEAVLTPESDLETVIISAPIKIKGEVFGAINVAGDPAKPALTDSSVRLLSTVATQASVAIQNSMLFEEMNVMYASTVRTLAEVIDAKDHYTHGHSERVADVSLSIAGELDLSKDLKEAIKTAAFLHDIGKISVPDAILHKTGELTPEEKEIIKTHPAAAAKILEPIVFPWDVATMVAQSHEHYDGSGYPSGLKGEEIDLGARIILVADAFEVLTSGRAYRKAMTKSQAVTEIRKCSGKQFDPIVVEALAKSQRIRVPAANVELKEII